MYNSFAANDNRKPSMHFYWVELLHYPGLSSCTNRSCSSLFYGLVSYSII